LGNVFTVSGLPGSGKSTVAHMLCKRFNLGYFSPGEYFRNIAEGKCIGIREYWATTTDADNVLVDKEQLAKARKGAKAPKGGVVLDGRYSGILCYQNGVEAFKIYLCADLEARAERVHKREPKKRVEEIMEEISLRQEREIDRGKKLYHADFTCPSFYDMCIDTTEMTPDQVVMLVTRSNNVAHGIRQLPEELMI